MDVSLYKRTKGRACFTIKKPFFFILLFLSVFLTQGCDNTYGKKTAEEEGYFIVHHPPNLAYECREVVSLYHEYCAMIDLGGKDDQSTTLKNINRKIESLQSQINNAQFSAQSTLPPSSLSDLYSAKLELFEYIANFDAHKDFNALSEKSAKYYKIKSLWLKSVTQREAVNNKNVNIKLSFQPKGLPLSIYSESGFSIGVTATTPIGNFTAGYSSEVAVELLVVKSRGKNRYFALSQPFELFVPSNFGISVSNGRKGTLTIEVLEPVPSLGMTSD
ncbi:MAG: hypothetical protein QNK37_07290 [Acidobacteriota bacterium]|nr:hypothetical protein [Acidobacteriota bacterium]